VSCRTARLIGPLTLACAVVLVACGAPATPTITPRYTFPPREAPTALPSPLAENAPRFGETVAFSLPGGAFVEFSLELEEADAVQITVNAVSLDSDGNAIDPVVEVLDSQWNRLAYSDKGTAEDGEEIIRIQLVAGLYIVRVNSFNGAQRGDMTLMLERDSDNDQE
jgi:hypothetical protein